MAQIQVHKTCVEHQVSSPLIGKSLSITVPFLQFCIIYSLSTSILMYCTALQGLNDESNINFITSTFQIGVTYIGSYLAVQIEGSNGLLCSHVVIALE